MSRKIKNIILISLMIVSSVMITLTIIHAKSNLVQDSESIGGMQGEIKGEKPSGMSSEMGELPSGEAPSGMPSGEKPSDISENSNELPSDLGEMPSGEKPSDLSSDTGELPSGNGPSDMTRGEMADGGFAGAGIENTTTYSDLTIGYIIFISVWCLVFSFCLIYLIMTNFSSKTISKIAIYFIVSLLITAILSTSTVVFTNKVVLTNSSSSSNSTLEYSSTDDLHISMDKWNYDETNNVYWQIGIVYCSNPEAVEYESMGIYVPGDYFTGTENSDGTYTCVVNTSSQVSGYTAKTAPIVMPVNTAGYSAQSAPKSYSYNGLGDYLEAGYIYVYAGCRGRNNGDDYSGGAPWGVTDLKAAVRYLRYNSDALPGDTNSIFAFGHSGGGAQSTVLGATGDSELYTPYLESIGAIMTDDNGNTISDAISGVMAWCPITSLDYANEAYEWNMGQYSTTGTRADTSWTSALSDDLAVAYAEYINELGLVDEDGNNLTLVETENGIYADGSYYDYMLNVIETSLNNYLSDNYASVSEMQSYIDTLNKSEEWVTFNKETKTATISSIEAFAQNCKSASKNVGAFDDLDRSQAENYVFGNDESDALHFDTVMANLLKENADKYSSYSDYEDYSEEYANDINNIDKLGKTSEYRQNMYNPMYYLSDYYEGYNTSTVAKYWRVHSGIEQGDTALTVETNLALALEQNDDVESIEFETVWEQGHTTAERTGDSTTNFINWINECLNK